MRIQALLRNEGLTFNTLIFAFGLSLAIIGGGIYYTLQSFGYLRSQSFDPLIKNNIQNIFAKALASRNRLPLLSFEGKPLTYVKCFDKSGIDVESNELSKYYVLSESFRRSEVLRPLKCGEFDCCSALSAKYELHIRQLKQGSSFNLILVDLSSGSPSSEYQTIEVEVDTPLQMLPESDS